MNYLINKSIIKTNLYRNHYNKPELYTVNNKLIIPKVQYNFFNECYSKIKLKSNNNICVTSLPDKFIFPICSIL